jgi:hypothetical protein
MDQPDEITNWEIFLWSLHELGGSNEFVDVEDVFLRCFEHASNRFSWRTRVDIPDYKKCSKAMRDADARSPRLLIKTKNGLRRQLTVEGQQLISSHEARLKRLQEADYVLSEPKQRPTARLLANVEGSSEFIDWLSCKTIPTAKWRMAELFHCSVDSGESVWRSRLEVLRSAAHAANKKDVLAFLEAVVRSHREWFDGV